MAVRVVVEKFTLGTCALCGKRDERLSSVSAVDACSACRRTLYCKVHCSRCDAVMGFACGRVPDDTLCCQCYSSVGVPAAGTSASDGKRKGRKRLKK